MTWFPSQVAWEQLAMAQVSPFCGASRKGFVEATRGAQQSGPNLESDLSLLLPPPQ